MKLLYEGKAKKIYNSDQADEVIIEFKDDATAFNGLKKDTLDGKGKINLKFTRYFFNLLNSHGIKSHVVSFLDETTLKAKKVDIFQIELVVRNYAAGSICKRLGFEKGIKFNPPMVELFLKDDSLGDPLLCKAHLNYMDLITEEDLLFIEKQALKINDILVECLDSKDVTLVDYKLEFGKAEDGEILLADEISPDNCRFWVKGTMESLDKDVYREDKADLVQSYSRLLEILGI